MESIRCWNRPLYPSQLHLTGATDMFVSPVVQERSWQILNEPLFASRTPLVTIPPFPDEVMLILAGILRVSS